MYVSQYTEETQVQFMSILFNTMIIQTYITDNVFLVLVYNLQQYLLCLFIVCPLNNELLSQFVN